MTWWVHSYVQAGLYTELIAWIFWVLLSITLHELGHGWAAIRQGDRTPIEMDRMTMNPLVHMGPMSLLMFALCGIAWGLMPVNPSRFKDGRRGEVYVAAAGPATNLLIAAACLVLQALWLKVIPTESWLYQNGEAFLLCGIWLNILLAGLNLLPIPPLDGSTILAGFSRRVAELYSRPQAAMVGMFIFVGIFFMTDIGRYFFIGAKLAAYGLTDFVNGLVGNPGLAEVMSS